MKMLDDWCAQSLLRRGGLDVRKRANGNNKDGDSKDGNNGNGANSPAQKP